MYASGMSTQQKEMTDIVVPEDVFAQLLSNISVAAQAQCRGGRDSHSAMDEPVRTTQNAAVLAGEGAIGGLLNSALEDDSDSSADEDEAPTDAKTDKDSSWPLAKWQHQVKMPQEATPMSVNQSSLGKTALATEKAFSSKLVRIVLIRTQQSLNHLISGSLVFQVVCMLAYAATGTHTHAERCLLQARAPLQDARKAGKASRKVQEDTAGTVSYTHLTLPTKA